MLRALAAVVTAAGLALPALPAAAAGLSLTVQPLVQELHVEPGGSGVLNIRVTNSGAESERVVIEAIDWNVSTDGSLQFRQADLANPNSITRYLSVPAYQFTVAAGATRAFPLTMRLPAAFPATAGVYWGGFLIRAAGAQTRGLGPAGTVFVYETVGTPVSKLALTAMRVTQLGANGAVLSARVRNDGNAYARATARLVIEHAGRRVRDENLTTPTIFPGAIRVLNGAVKGLEPGDYRAELTIDYGTDVVLTGTTEFLIR
jgi:hypothetical protein